MPSLGRLQINRARQEHECSECETPIEAGQVCWSLSGPTKGGRWINNRLHLPCLILLGKRRYAQRDIASLPTDQKGARRKLLMARSYAVRTGNKDRLKEIQQALEAFGVKAPYRRQSKIAAEALRTGETVEAVAERKKARLSVDEQLAARGWRWGEHKPTEEEKLARLREYEEQDKKPVPESVEAEVPYHLQVNPTEPVVEPKQGWACRQCGVPTKLKKHARKHREWEKDQAEMMAEYKEALKRQSPGPVEGEEE